MLWLEFVLSLRPYRFMEKKKQTTNIFSNKLIIENDLAAQDWLANPSAPPAVYIL